MNFHIPIRRNGKGPAGVDITCGALLRMLKVEWGMLNSHSSSFSLAGGRRACPALKPDAADQVLLKNRAGFAAFSKGRTFHHVWNRIAARVTGRRGPAGAIRWIGCTGSAGIRLDGGGLLWAMPVSRDVSPRLILQII